MAELGRERCRVEGLLAETAAEMHRRMGGRGAAAMMRERLRVSSRQATAEVELAAALASEFPATLDALRSGEITSAHARVIARVAADPDHADEAALLEMARGYPVDMFSRMTRHYMSSGASCEERKRQHENRWASLVQDPDGSWRLSAYFDHDTGKRVSVSFNQMVRNYRNSERGHQDVNSQQRRADALADLITGEGPHQRPKVTLLMIADYDTVTRELRNLRYDDGLPVSVDQIAKLTSDVKILPAIFNAEGDPLWLGRAQRDASAGQRIVLAARDGGCVNCGSPSRTRASLTTSSGSPAAAPPTLTTSPCCANAATTSSTTMTGNSTATTANTDSSPRHTPGPAGTSKLVRPPSGTLSCEPDGGPAPVGATATPGCCQRVRMSWNSMIP